MRPWPVDPPASAADDDADRRAFAHGVVLVGSTTAKGGDGAQQRAQQHDE